MFEPPERTFDRVYGGRLITHDADRPRRCWFIEKGTLWVSEDVLRDEIGLDAEHVITCEARDGKAGQEGFLFGVTGKPRGKRTIGARPFFDIAALTSWTINDRPIPQRGPLPAVLLRMLKQGRLPEKRAGMVRERAMRSKCIAIEGLAR